MFIRLGKKQNSIGMVLPVEQIAHPIETEQCQLNYRHFQRNSKSRQTFLRSLCRLALFLCECDAEKAENELFKCFRLLLSPFGLFCHFSIWLSLHFFIREWKKKRRKNAFNRPNLFAFFALRIDSENLNFWWLRGAALLSSFFPKWKESFGNARARTRALAR